MESHLLDKYGMFLKVEDFFDDHTTETAPVTVIAPKKAELSANIVKIAEAEGLATTDNSGVTIDKGIQRVELTVQMMISSTAVSNFARDNNNNTLLNKVRYTLSKLQGMRDNNLYIKAIELKKAVDANIASLAVYLYLPANQTDLETAMDSYFDARTEPKDAIEASAASAKYRDRLFIETDKIIESLDGYMDIFRFSNTELWDEYQLARAIDDAGGGSGGGDISASGVLTAGQTQTVVTFTYDPAYTVSLKNNGLAPLMQVSLLQDGVPVPSADIKDVEFGVDISFELGTWAVYGNEISVHNPDLAQSVGYSVSLGI
jgi:hypothetical protein